MEKNINTSVVATTENLDDTNIYASSASPTQPVVEATDSHFETAEILDICATDVAELTETPHTEEDLIPNDTTFNELLVILRANPRNAVAAQIEAEEQEREAKEAQLLKELGDDYEVVFEQQEDGYDKVAEQVAQFYRPKRRPGAVQLRASEKRIAKLGLGSGLCEVFANGYAIYDNGDRKTVIWVESCGTATYYFTPLRDNELQYMSQKEYIGLDVLGDEPWYTAIIMRGEEQIISNMEHPKSKGTASDSDDPSDWEDKGTYRWSAGAHFDSPEVAYLKKEAQEERRKLLTDKQWEAYVMYFEDGLNQYEIADILGLNRKAVGWRINGALKKIKKSEKIL